MRATKMMRRTGVFVVAAAMLAACANGSTTDDTASPAGEDTNGEETTTEGGGESTGEGEQPEEYVIGDVQPLTGAAAAFGEYAVTGGDLAVTHVNEDGGINGAELRIAREDGQCDPQTSIVAMERVLEQADPPVITTSCSSVVLAQAPVAERTDTLLMNIAAQSPLLAGASENLFSVIPTSAAEIEAMVDLAYDEVGLQTAAVLHVDNDLGTGDLEVFREAWEGKGGEVVAVESFDVGATDMRTALTRIRSTDPDALYIVGNVDEVGYATAQVSELGMDTQLIGRTNNTSPEVLELAGEGANGIIGVGNIFREDVNDVAQRFADAYREEFGEEPSVYAALAYDAIRMVAQAYGEVGTETSAIAEYLRNLESFTGAMGDIRMTEDQVAQYPLFTYEIVDGEIVEYSG